MTRIQRDPIVGTLKTKGLIVQPIRALIEIRDTEALGAVRPVLLGLVLITGHKGAAAGSE